MKKIYFLYLCDDDVGEVEGMFDEQGEMLGNWCCNDATWRGEYFNGFIESLGYEVISDIPEDLEPKLEAALKAVWF